MSVLKEICLRKKEHIAQKKTKTSLETLQCKMAEAPAPLGFVKALKNCKGTAIIAEVKKASPSKGIIRADFDASEIAGIYEESGACCLSVLTDEPYFQGHDNYLVNIKARVNLPVLRKDFMLDAYQIYESRALGADCILLIMAALSEDQAKELYNLSQELGMDVLAEVHNAEELELALKLKPEMIGINNRDLKSLEVDVHTSYDLVGQISEDVIKISESGIESRDTIERLQAAGFDGFLIGESLMRQQDIGAALGNLLNKN